MPANFVELETAVLQAIVDRDWDSLAELLDDDFVITTAGWLGTPATKATWVAEVAEQHHVHGFEIHSVDVRDLGAVVVVLMLSTQMATWREAPFEGRFRYTDVWRRAEDDRWSLVVRHASLLPDGPT
jgi:ketosteroid isomerase-like protein